MDNSTFFLVIPFLLTFIYVFTISGRRNPRLPPGPYPFPIIGNLLKLGNKPHRSLATLSECYGPLMSLKLGSRTTIVVSSPQIAEEFLHKHDRSFSSRSVPETVRVNDHHKCSMAWLPAGDQWRRLRRITKECLFSGQCLDASQQLRMQKVQELIDHLSQCCKEQKAVNLEIKDVIWGVMEVGGKPNLVDFFPILRPLDPQGLASQVDVYLNKLFAIFGTIIDQRLQTRGIASSNDNCSSTQNDDVLDFLLNINFKDESEFSIEDMKHLFSDLFVAGTDTVSTTLEWAMTELIRNPKKMEKTRFEVMKCMQKNDKTLKEKDIPQLPYLHAVIKETLRLHPPAPFLIPHQAVHDVEAEGFIVPKDAQILFNVWAMGRDPNVWPNSNEFMPERFLDIEIDYTGHDFKLIPFGAGRRICPGLNIAHRVLHTILGSLVYNFDWKLEGNMKAQDLDMEEKFGLTLPRNVQLMAIPVKL